MWRSKMKNKRELFCETCGSETPHVQHKNNKYIFFCEQCGTKRRFAQNPISNFGIKCCVCNKKAVRFSLGKAFCELHDSTFTHSKQTGASPGEKLKQDKIN